LLQDERPIDADQACRTPQAPQRGTFSAVITVIADLDRPGQGFIDVSQQPMLDLRAVLAESKP
jgi:hypothetical protein